MKRDMELVRKILMQLDEYEHGFAPDNLTIKGYTDEQIGYHCYLMNDAGLIDAIDATSQMDKSPCALPKHLTWKGHEFLDNSKNPDVWEQAKAVVSKLGDVSFNVWASVLSKIVLQNLGIDAN